MDSSDSFTNFELRIYSFFSEYLLLFNWQTEKKKCLGPSNSYGSSFFFFKKLNLLTYVFVGNVST